uniref:Uncharacterized protein n=1 Tax=viral metagenome TaxID=1070528 RepID=A0A6M3ILI6_9ZZZZ
MIIKIFWHILLQNHWYCIVTCQLRILLYSGLYDACDSITIGCLGDKKERDYLQRFIIDMYPKIKIGYFSENPLEYEFPTLKLIEEDNSEYTGLYFHNKSVTKPNDTIISHWKYFLEEKILNQWGQHYQNILKGFDVSSVNYLRSPNHFSGNFWWFNREYIYNCPMVDKLNHNYRWHAEQWICMGKGNFYYPAFQEPGETVFKIKQHGNQKMSHIGE